MFPGLPGFREGRGKGVRSLFQRAEGAKGGAKQRDLTPFVPFLLSLSASRLHPTDPRPAQREPPCEAWMFPGLPSFREGRGKGVRSLFQRAEGAKGGAKQRDPSPFVPSPFVPSPFVPFLHPDPFFNPAAHGNGGTWREWLLLALVHHSQAHREEALVNLNKARDWRKTHPDSPTESLAWRDRIDFDSLLTEAQKLIEPEGK